MERNRYKIHVWEITLNHLSHHDIVWQDREGNFWQLILLIGIDSRWRMVGGQYYKWLIFHPNGGYRIHNIESNVFVYLDALTKE
jgi:hypothetical protein